MDIIDAYLYTKEHEWVNIEDNIGTVGISEYAQAQLGDVTYIELPAAGSEVEQFEQLASVESVKAASDIFSPMSGTVTEVNTRLDSDPGLLNKNCYDSGWIAKVDLSALEESSNLMTADEYRSFLEAME